MTTCKCKHGSAQDDNMQARQCARCTGAVRRTKRPAERCADPNKACGGRTLPRFGQSCQRRQTVMLRIVAAEATFRKLTAFGFLRRTRKRGCARRSGGKPSEVRRYSHLLSTVGTVMGTHARGTQDRRIPASGTPYSRSATAAQSIGLVCLCDSISTQRQICARLQLFTALPARALYYCPLSAILRARLSARTERAVTDIILTDRSRCVATHCASQRSKSAHRRRQRTSSPRELQPTSREPTTMTRM
jgi:hypothetical protein